jgi:hypothetical protein
MFYAKKDLALFPGQRKNNILFNLKSGGYHYMQIRLQDMTAVSGMAGAQSGKTRLLAFQRPCL